MSTPLSNQPSKGFNPTGLDPVILGALSRLGLTTPTPIQAKAIPEIIAGQDIIGLAQTGTGKTLSFGLPIIHNLLNQKDYRALILVPTRELALQVEASIKRVSLPLNAGIRTIAIIGGEPIYRQIKVLKSNPSIIIATPGRLRDHLEQKTVNLANINTLVLDEADRMLDMGFAPQIKNICLSLPRERQTLLFSATFAPEIANLAQSFQRNPRRIEVERATTDTSKINQELCYVQTENKPELLHNLLQEHAGTFLVFSRTKHGASKLATKLERLGHTATEIHSNRSLSQRKKALEGFKGGRYRVLVATDIAARGIDVRNIQVVINYDLPDAAEDYIHRIGRTGRAGQTGRAISLATPEQQRDVRTIERLIGASLSLSKYSEPKPVFKNSTSQLKTPGNRNRPIHSSRPAKRTFFTHQPIHSKRREGAFR